MKHLLSSYYYLHFLFYFFNFFSLFLMWTIFKVFIKLITILLLCYFWFFGHEACGFLAPQPGLKPTSPALEGKVLTNGLPRKSQYLYFKKKENDLLKIK